MSGPKKKSLVDMLLGTVTATQDSGPKAFAEKDVTTGIATSESQIDKAAAGLTGDWASTVASVSAEQQKLDDIKIQKIKKENEEQVRKEGLLTPQDTVEEKLKVKNGDESFLEYKKDKEKLEKLQQKNTDFLDDNGINLFSPFYKLRDAFVDDKDKWGKTDIESADYKTLIKKQQRVLLPVLKDMRAEYDTSLKAKQEKYDILKQEVDKENIQKSNEMKNMDFSTFIKEGLKGIKKLGVEDTNDLDALRISARYDKEGVKLIDDFLQGKNTVWDGLINHKRDLKTIGINNTVEDYVTMQVAKRADEVGYDNLTDAQKELLISYAKRQDISGKSLMKSDSWVPTWYSVGDGTGQSLVFMEGMMATSEFGSIAEAGVEGSIKGGVRKLTNKVIEKTLTGSAARKLGVGLLRNTGKVLAEAVDLGASSAISPFTYSSQARKSIGNTEIVVDKDGNKKVLVRKSIYDKYRKDYETNKLELESQYNKLLSKPSRTKSEEDELDNIKDSLDNIDQEMQMLRPKSAGESFLYGLTETMKEYGSEKYVGEAVQPYLANNKLTKYLAQKISKTKVGQAFKYLNEISKKGSNIFNNTSLGQISSRAMHHTGGYRMYDGLAGEVFEEIATQITPTLGEDYSNQLKELKNPSFYADIISQTLLMGGGTTTLGLGNQLLNYKNNKEFYNKRTAIRNAYNRIDKATNDADLAETIVMSTGGTGFSVADYDHRIAKLKSEGKEKQANDLEQKKFFNLAISAIHTDTLDEFKETLDRVHNNPDISDDTKVNIGLAKEKINEIESTYNKFRDRPNVGNIVSLAAQKLTNKQSMAHLDAEINTQKNIAREEIDAFKERANIKTDYSIDTLLDRKFDNEEDQKEYDSFLKKLEKEDNHSIDTLVGLQFAKDNLQYAHLDTMRQFNEQVSPKYQENLKKEQDVHRQVNNALMKIQEGDIESANAEFNFNNQLKITKPLIHDIFNAIDTKELSKEKVNEIRDSYIKYSERQDLTDKLRSIEDINKKYEAQQEEKAQEIGIDNNQDTTDSNLISDTPTVASQEADNFDAPGFSEDEMLDDPNDDKGYDSLDSPDAQYARENPTDDFNPDVINEKATEDTVIDNMNAISEVTDTPVNYTRVQSDDLFDDISLQPQSTAEFDDNKKGVVATAVKNVHDFIGKSKGVNPSFEDLVYHFIRYGGEELAENQFDAYKLGWEMNGFPKTNFTEVYDNIFDPAKTLTENAIGQIADLFGTVKVQEPSIEEVATNTIDQEKQIEEDAAVITSFTEDNIPVRTIGGKRINHPKLKLAFNAIKYDEVETDGVFKRITSLDAQLNLDEESILDFRDLLNPNKYNTGAKLNVAMAPESLWNKIKVVIGRTEEGKAKLKSFSEILEENERTNPNFRNTKEFRDIVPIITFGSNGVPLSFIHDINWYNPFNVADPAVNDGTISPTNISPLQAKLIQEGKENVSKLREAILNKGVNNITIEEKSEGAFYTIAGRIDKDGNTLPLYSIAEANPQAEIVIQVNQGELEQGKNNSFENSTRKVINKAQILSDGGPGHTWNLRRIGVDPTDNKETWRAFKVFRYVTESQLETVKWAWAAYARFDTTDTIQNGKPVQIIQEVYSKNVTGTSYDLSEEQAQKIVDDIKRETGYNLKRFQDAQAFFKLYFQPRTGDSLAEFGRSLYKEETNISTFSQHTLNDGLRKNPQMVNINNGEVIPLNQTYTDYLKDNLKTDVKSFNVGTEENPVYATSVQPVILFSYSNEDAGLVETPELNIQERNTLIQEIVEAPSENVSEVLDQFEDLKKSLGFNFDSFSAMPVTMQGTDSLEDIFHITPGLSINQEKQLVNFIYTNISSAIDIKYKAKVNKAQLLEDVMKSYDDIIAPSRRQVEAFVAKLRSMAGNAKVDEAITQGNSMLEVFDNIKNNWSVPAIKEHLESEGRLYSGQLGLVEKAMIEVNKTSDIKEQQETEEEQQEEEDTSQRIKSYEDNASLTENGKQKTTYRLRRFMAGVHRKNTNGETKKGFLGLPEYVGFNEVYDTIYQLLGTGAYIPSDYKIMKEKILEMQQAQPWVTELMAKFDEADEQLRKEFVYNYRKHAISMKFAMYSIDNDGTSLKVFDTNANEITRVIIDGWKSNLITSPLLNSNKNGYTINKDTVQKLLETYNKWSENFAGVSEKELSNWLDNFGIELSEDYLEELKEEGFRYKGKIISYPLMFSGSNTFVGLLHTYLQNVSNKENVAIDESELNHPFGNMSGVLKALAKGESRYTLKMLSKSFRDAGKNISGLTNPTYVTNRIDDLKRGANPSSSDNDRRLIRDLQSLSLSQDSLILRLLMEEPDFYSKFEANHLGLTALKELNKKSSNFASISDLNSLDHDETKLTFFQDTKQETISSVIGGFGMRMARMFLPTMSDKTQMLTLATGVFNFMQESDLAFNRDSEGNVKFTEDLRDLLYEQLALPELRRIINFQNNVKSTNIKDYDSAAQIFNFIPALNNIKGVDGNRMIKDIALKDNITLEQVEGMYKAQMKDVIEGVMHKLVEDKKAKFENSIERDKQGKATSIKIFDKDYVNKGKGTIEEKFEHGIYDYILNSTITNANMFTIIAGDPALYSQDKLFKSEPLSYDSSDDNFYIGLSKKIGVNIGKRLALLVAPGATLADSYNKEYKQVFLSDSSDISSNSEYLISLFYSPKDLKERLTEETGVTVQEGLDKVRDKNVDKATKKKIKTALSNKFPSLADYFDIESTDAQEYTTVKEHIYILRNQGRISDEQNVQILDKLEAGLDLTKEELNLVMQPIKPVYTGQIFEREANGSIKNDVARTLYIKSSSFPLLPQVTKGTELDKLRLKLEELETKHGMPVRASYQTANKVGAMKTTVDILSDESLKTAENSMLTLNRNDFRIQQDVPFKSDSKKEDKISMGTQIFKLLFGDGMLDLDGFHVDGNNYNGRELYDYYAEAFEGLAKIKRNNLFDELGLDEQGFSQDSTESIKKLQSLLQKEAVKRGYPIQDIKGLELDTLYDTKGEPYHEFKIPLWLSTNSNRYESLLNSIVTNRMMKFKIPGNSFVAGSENGFAFQENLSGVDKSRIIYMDNWNGKELGGVSEINADGETVFSKAQVFVPSKFKTTDGKLLDLFKDFNGKEGKYLERRENGTLKLKEGMIDPALFNSFSFRTPTSSHVSASTIEIAGILPSEVGDLMIVPKNFTKQKGLDFDVDKENVYQLNHVVDFETGKVQVLDEEYKEKALRKLKKLLKDEQGAIDSAFGLPSMDVFYSIIEAEFDTDLVSELQDTGATLEKQIKMIEAKYDEKLYENKFIKAHLAVYNNSNQEVQKKINKVLSMDFAREQADRIEELIDQSEQNKVKSAIVAEGLSEVQAAQLSRGASDSFTILSEEYQKQKMGLGAAGKVAIGIYSNYVTFHGLIQQAKDHVRILNEFGGARLIQIGDNISSGILGEQMTLDKSRSIAEAFAEKQNTATDNEKEQILGRVNVNSMTIGFDSLLTLLGFDKDENGNSIPYQILSQPILREFVDSVNSQKGITSTFKRDLEKVVVQQLLDKYAVGQYTLDKSGKVIDATNNSFVDKGNLLNGDNLTKGIKNNGQDTDVQIAALALFLDLNSYAKDVAKVQSVVNTNNLGKSMIESAISYDNLASFADNKNISGIASILGEFIPADSTDKKKLGEGYYLIRDYYIKPTTPQGQIAIHGLVAGKRLWEPYFPYNNFYFNSVIEEVINSGNFDVSSGFKAIEANHDIIEESKKYLYSWRGLGIFEGMASENRQRLFIDSNSNTSLANYLNANKELPILTQNRLLNKFTYELELNGKPSIIKFNNTISDDFEEEYLYSALAEMIIEDKPLPEYNGESFSTRALAQELITYAYVEGGVQEAIQFIKYVPLEYLSEIGIEQGGEFTSAIGKLQRMSASRDSEVFKKLFGFKTISPSNPAQTHTFVKQYFQHNPDKVNQYSADVIKKQFAYNADHSSFVFNSEEAPKFISVRNKTKSKLKQDKFSLYQNVGNNIFNKIDVLGINGMNEYELLNENAKTILKVENESKNLSALSIAPVQPNLSSKEVIPIIQDGATTSDILRNIMDIEDGGYARYISIAEMLLPMADNTTKVSLADSEKILGVKVNGAYSSKSNTLFIDESALDKNRGVGTFMHEFVHSITKKEVEKYYNDGSDGTLPGTRILPNAPKHVVDLHLVWLEFKKQLDPEVLRNVSEKAVKLYNKQQAFLTEEELGIAYAGVDIFEFMAVALTSKDFQVAMSKVPYMQTNKSILDKFKDVIINILKLLNPTIEENSIAEAAIRETLNFVEIEKDYMKPKETLESFDIPGFAEDTDLFAEPGDNFDDDIPSGISLKPTTLTEFNKVNNNIEDISEETLNLQETKEDDLDCLPF